MIDVPNGLACGSGNNEVVAMILPNNVGRFKRFNEL